MIKGTTTVRASSISKSLIIAITKHLSAKWCFLETKASISKDSDFQIISYLLLCLCVFVSHHLHVIILFRLGI